jgi:DNA adenine methylase
MPRIGVSPCCAVKSPFRYPGGKSTASVRRLILPFAPGDMLEYREPFVGGGGIFFGLQRRMRVWLNDLNPALMSVYLALRDRPGDFIASCEAIDSHKREENEAPPVYNCRLRRVFDGFKSNAKMDQALRYFFLNRTVWMGRVIYDPSRSARLYFSNPQGWSKGIGDRLRDASEKLRGVKLTCLDFEPLFQERGKGVWIYADPPYYRDLGLPRMDKQYDYGFSAEDHERLQETVAGCKHRVCLSYDDHPRVQEWAQKNHLRVFPVEWTYRGSSLKRKVHGKELLITNY